MFSQFILRALEGLLYPSLCYACKSEIVSSVHPICISCEYRIRPAFYCLDHTNPVSERLSMLLDYKEASCGFVFAKGGGFYKQICGTLGGFECFVRKQPVSRLSERQWRMLTDRWTIF